jgi:small subunit ribosomal protein S20
MATHKSALKKHRQSVARRDRNRNHRSRLRTEVKKYRKAIADGEIDLAKGMLPGLLSLVDRTVKLNALHANTGSRHKSRLTKALLRQSSGA